ncbi:MAG: SRPBCC family protein [Nocardioides sp.]
MTLEVSHTRTLPVPVERAFDGVLPLPLPQLFRRRYLAIPPIVRVAQDGEWGTVGQRRTIHTSDGGSMVETLTTLERPCEFGYELGTITGPNKALIRGVRGRWSFAEAGTGTAVTWSWTITPTRVGALLMPVFARLWQGYARQGMEEIERVLVAR